MTAKTSIDARLAQLEAETESLLGRIEEGETMTLKVIVLAKEPMKEGAVFWRTMGIGDYERTPLKHVARGVHTARFPTGGAKAAGLEYHVKVVLEGGKEIFFPATAPAINHTLVATPWSR